MIVTGPKGKWEMASMRERVFVNLAFNMTLSAWFYLELSLTCRKRIRFTYIILEEWVFTVLWLDTLSNFFVVVSVNRGWIQDFCKSKNNAKNAGNNLCHIFLKKRNIFTKCWKFQEKNFEGNSGANSKKWRESAKSFQKKMWEIFLKNLGKLRKWYKNELKMVGK